ncbi:UDP-2,4-diacetamido-2,4,6-trideoxy-beta-L-altropyranose hydrolase [Chitinimonas naiadis]
MKVLIRADASRHIGSGHVARCLTLAHVLRARGAEVSFACRELPGNALQRIAEAGFPALLLPSQYPGEAQVERIQDPIPWQADIDALGALLPAAPRFDWIVLDHYGLDASWQSAARRYAQNIAVIDDLANRPHDADLLLDQSLTAGMAAYERWLPVSCQTLFGPRYALLRPEFASAPIEIRDSVKRVLVSFGGVDLGGETFKTMNALADMAELEVDFVAGAANPAWDRLQSVATGHGNWHLYQHVHDFAALMRQADLFIGAGGGTSWERAALGLPTICIAVAANQQPNAEQLAAVDAHCYLGPSAEVSQEDLQRAIKQLAIRADIRKAYGEKSRILVDGKGAQRVAAAMLVKGLALRAATLADAKLLFDGRNAESVRRWSINPAPIIWAQHLSWLQAVLQRQDRLLLIGEFEGVPVGVLRYDRNAEQSERVEVSIYLLPGKEGQGWGAALLAAGDQYVTRHWSGLAKIDATVLPDNRASIKLFIQAGYQQQGEHFERIVSLGQHEPWKESHE